MTCSQISPSLRSSPRSQQTRTFYQHRYGKGDIWAGAPFVLHFSTVNMLFQSTSLFASSSPHHVQSSAVIYSMWQAGGSGVVNQPHPHRHVGLKTAVGNLSSCKSGPGKEVKLETICSQQQHLLLSRAYSSSRARIG